ncbi:MAG: NACHT domain-containing protein [Gammaproteobacteria bacterium]|nr:NACHT domain-containing protein [Gammaproteobacteria bacterium]
MTAVASHDFKRTAVARGGFEYQDLVAVEILIDFLRHPNLYDWVQVEAEDGRYQAIDDVVACRKDGRLELTQVKFTPDPQNPDRALSWEWLTGHTPNGTSLLQKWAKTVLAHRNDDKLAVALLKTDRMPDLQFAKCLDGRHVDYRRLSPETKALVDAQLGSEGSAVAFFESFEFAHSMERFDDYEETLRSRLRHDTDKGGWAYLRQEVRRWAMRKMVPPPDGKIRHFHLLGVFSPDRPVALRQDFAVPPGYRVPDDGFHQRFIGEAAAADGIAVLWGPPGRGKSTYLSHCVSELAHEDDVVCVRHHYFLRLDERGEGRFSYFAIERSLIQQLSDANLPGAQQNDGLARALAAAASELRASGRRLVVVVDGLDHVWRDQGDTAQMQLLFAALLPLPEGVRLLVGTQRVENEHLPRQLLRALPKDRWTELPTMSVAAVRDWLGSRAAGDRVRVAESPVKTDEEVMDELGSAFHRISAGLPLHLVYSLEALVKSGEPLTVDAVLQLPPCPSGEIEHYYETLWVRLGSAARRVLHLLAGLRFGPPSLGLGTSLNADVSWWQVLDEIGHLLECREASVVPFHGSLFAFLRDRPDHRLAFLSLAPNVLTWLERAAPEYWRRAWLWVMRADLGNAADLVRKPSRDWSIDWLASGYPVDQLVYILSRAEEAALDAFDLPRLIRLRSLKTRALNARKYQSNEWGSFWETSLALSRDQHLGAVLWDRLPGLETEELPAVADFRLGIPADAGQLAIDELNRRNAASSSGDDHGHWDTYSRAVVRVVARQPEEHAERVIAFARDSGAEGLIDVYTSESLAAGNHGHVFAVASRRSAHRLDRDAFAALCLEGIGPGAGPGLAADRPGLRCLALLTGADPPGQIAETEVSHLWTIEEDFGVGHAVRQAGHEVFFASLAAALSGKVARARADLGEAANGTWLGSAIRALENEAGAIGAGWLAADRWPTLGDVYRKFTLPLPAGPSSREQSAIGGVRLALQDIAVDLCLLGTGILGLPKIDGRDVRAAEASPLWSMEAWLETFCERRVPVHSAEGANVLLDLVATHLDARVVEFGERATIAARAARFAVDHGLYDRSRDQLRRTADCLLGYGYRKDVFVFEVLSALRLLADEGDEEARDTFLSLAREIEAITDYTDGDETRHARTELHQGVAELFPERVPALYAELAAAQEWYRAEELAKIWAKTIPAGSEPGRMLLSTFIAPGEFNAAWDAAGTMDETGTPIREALARLTGRDRPLPNRHGISGSSNDEPREIPDASEFEPGRLADFIRSAREDGPLYDRGAVSQWLAHWDAQGRHADALADLRRLAADRAVRYDLTDALDTAFEISRNSQGRSEAYVWLVRAMVEHRGWVRWWSSDATFRQRVRAVVRDYPEKRREFVVETSRTEPLGELEDNGIAVGLSRLVYFLVEVGEKELAKRCAMEMVEVFRDEVSEQPLTSPDWAR